MEMTKRIKPSNVSIEFFEENSMWYMKWTIIQDNCKTVIPMIGPIASSSGEIVYKASRFGTSFFREYTEEFIQQHGHTYKLHPKDVCITDSEGTPHLCNNVTKATIYNKPPKKKMTLKEIEKELGYEIDLVEEVDPK